MEKTRELPSCVLLIYVERSSSAVFPVLQAAGGPGIRCGQEGRQTQELWVLLLRGSTLHRLPTARTQLHRGQNSRGEFSDSRCDMFPK